MKTIQIAFGVVLATWLAQGVSAQNSIVGNGQIVKQERTLGSFDKLVVRTGMRVHISAGDAGKAELEGESNILEHVVTNVKNGELTITLASNQSYNQTKGVTVTIHVPRLSAIMVSTGCAVDSDIPLEANTLTATVETGSRMTTAISAKNLKLTVKEGSQANLRGTATEADIRLSGAAKLNADKLTLARASVHMDGASHADIHVTETLTASADGVSTLTYSGNPTVKSQEATGLSKIRKQG